MMVDLIFVAFVLLAPLLFLRLRPPVAAVSIFLGGWVLLPVGHYPEGSAAAIFPYWIIGLALPSDMLLTKAWIAPASALLGVAIFDRKSLRGLRPDWVDLPMGIWCLWPFLASMLSAADRPQGWIASLYLIGTWSLPWLLGRIYFSTEEGRKLLLRAIAWSGLACLPFSLIEGVFGPILYSTVYENHPFRNDGALRYLGYRPLGFFEHGNQFGIWVCLSALAAFWSATTARGDRKSVLRLELLAMGVGAMALAAQSVGSILLLGAGAAFLSLCRWLKPRVLVLALLGATVVLGAVYLSGRVPIMHIAKDTAFGQRIVGGLHDLGRGSLGWRIVQDQKLLPQATAHPVLGSETWDWWRNYETRPWSLVMLVLGQFGLTGLVLSMTVLLLPAVRYVMRWPQRDGWSTDAESLVLATLIALTVIDAMMNSFIFFPAILAAGALATAAPFKVRRGEITRISKRATA